MPQLAGELGLLCFLEARELCGGHLRIELRLRLRTPIRLGSRRRRTLGTSLGGLALAL